MEVTIIEQAQLFGIYIIIGIIIGIFFDLFRILRRSFKTPDIVTYIEDIIFGILTGIFLIFILFIFNNGELRFYIFLAIMLGLVFYLLTISKYFIKINVKVIVSIKKFLKKILSIILYPIILLKKLLSKLLLKPFRILTININNTLKVQKRQKNNMKNQKQKTKIKEKIEKNKKTTKFKKDFSK